MWALLIPVVVVGVVLLVWLLGAPPRPGPAEKANPGRLWTLFVMRAMRVLGLPKVYTTPQQVFSDVEKQSAGCVWKNENEKKNMEVPVRLICELMNTPRVHPFGRVMLKTLVIQRLVERRQVWQAHRDHPELSAIPMKKPIFILGFPRAGSSFLFSLLCKDPENRYLTLWDQMDSTYADPSDKKRTEKLRASARRLQSRIELLYQNVAEELKHKHTLDVERPEECQILLQKGLMFTQISDNQAYRDWFSFHDATEDYELHKANVQLIQHNRPIAGKNRWVFKAPAHTHHLKSLLKVYPDAIVILTLREPVKIAGSIASLRSTMQQLVYDPIDMSGQNRQNALEFIPNAFRNALPVIKSDPNPKRFFSCQYEELIKDPIAMIKQIYAHNQLEYTAAYDSILQAFVKKDQQQHSATVRHEYKLEDFGISKDNVREAYREYCEFGGFVV